MSAHAAARPSPAYRRAVEDLRSNPGQWQAYNSQGHCVVLAGPGSGKTKTLTVKITKLLIESTQEPRGLACITYNSECARELKTRLEGLGIRESEAIFIGTVHSFCLQKVVVPYASLAGVDIPKNFQVAIKSEQDALFSRAVAVEIGSNERPWDWRQRADKYRRTHLDRDTTAWREDEQLAALISRYEKLLRERNMIDFDDMVLIGLRLIESHNWVRRILHAKFPAVVVDEYQDLGVPLHRIVESLCFLAGSRLFAVGDPDQSIYSFTGARPELLRQLASSPYVETVRLPFNYRSGPTIVRASEIALGEDRGYQARGTTEGTVDFHERPEGLEDQADYICSELIPSALARISGLRLGDIAILYLDKNDGTVIANKAAEYNFPTIRIDQGAPYPKTPLTRWTEACAAWCAGGWRMGKPPLSSLLSTGSSLLKIWHLDDRQKEEQKSKLLRFLMPRRNPNLPLHDWIKGFRDEYLGEVLAKDATLVDEKNAFEKIIEASMPEGVIAEWTTSTFGGQGGSPNHLNLITLHSAKGLEFRIVIMMGMDQGRIPHWAAGDLQKREQRRLFYVGLSRAKEEVHMTYSGWTQNQYGRRFFYGPSEFLTEVRNQLEKSEN